MKHCADITLSDSPWECQILFENTLVRHGSEAILLEKCIGGRWILSVSFCYVCRSSRVKHLLKEKVRKSPLAHLLKACISDLCRSVNHNRQQN